MKGEKPLRRKPIKASSTLSGEDVVALIQQILVQNGPQKEPELRNRLGEIAAEEGKSRKGLHFTFAKAIRNERFQWTGVRWSLKEAK